MYGVSREASGLLPEPSCYRPLATSTYGGFFLP